MSGRRGAVFGTAIVLSCVSCSRRERDPGTARLSVAAIDSAIQAPATPAGATRPDAKPQCDPGQVLVLASPEHPTRGQPFRVIAVSDRRIEASLVLGADAGVHAAAAPEEGAAGPPFLWMVFVDDAKQGTSHVAFTGSQECDSRRFASLDVVVSGRIGPAALPPPRKGLWLTRRSWSSPYENLYSAWIAHLFRAPPGALPTWRALDEVISDRSRNFLFDHLGAAEDEQKTTLRPDCADLPYFLRAYFSFKLGLPFGWSNCSRGDSTSPPTCRSFATSEEPFGEVDGGPEVVPPWADRGRRSDGSPDDNAERVRDMLRTTLADAVQSGAGRTRAEDEETDYYPVALTLDSLRPGTIFADPYGHVLVVAARVDQTPSSAGALFAVDAQPDGTVSRKRFWRGNFLFAVDPILGSAGFKRFRPVLRDRRSGVLRRARNAELSDYSASDQYDGGIEGFYDKVEDLLSPAPLDPTQALLGTLQALDEQVRARVTSVDNGRHFLAASPAAADMPEGEKIFETVGAWEDFATPSRDLRLLIAIDVMLALPQTVARRPRRFTMPEERSGAQVSAELEELLARELSDRRSTYVRSDGSEWSLTLKDVVDRRAALEMAYDPNDCVEARWGAPPGSDESSTCRAHAPPDQVAKMVDYRAWFHERRRPAR
jgi:hypothetical protein